MESWDVAEISKTKVAIEIRKEKDDIIIKYYYILLINGED
jgi:hypothetical protein